MTTKHAFRTKEPLLIIGENNYFSVLPIGTAIYYDRSWPEGHSTYHVYFSIKGHIRSDPIDAEMIDPLWLANVDATQLPKLLNDYPLSKKELIEILKAKEVTKADLIQIVRDWPDE